MILSNTAATAFVHDEPIATSYTPVAPPVDFDNNRDTDAYIRPNDHGGEDRDGSLISVPITKSTKLFAFCAALNSCNLGYNLGVVAGAAPMVQSTLNLSNVQLELFIGATDLFSMFGALSSSFVADAMGRRWSLRVSAIIFVIGMTIESASYSYATLVTGRALVGLGVGFGLAIDPIYISEISTAAHRGQLVTWSEIAINIGIVLGFASGLFTSKVEEDLAWRIMFAAGAILPCFVIFLSVSESNKKLSE